MNTNKSLSKLVEDNERLQIEHKLSFDEANRLWIENIQALYKISKFEADIIQIKQERTQALNENSKLKAELSAFKKEQDHALDIQALYKISKFEADITQIKQQRTQALNEYSKLEAELSASQKERDQAFDDASKLRSKLGRCDTEKEQAFTEISRLKKDLSRSMDECLLLQQTLKEKQIEFKEREEEKQAKFETIRQQKDSLQAKIFECQARLEQTRLDKVECQTRLNQTLVDKTNILSKKDLWPLTKQKETLEALVYQLEIDFRQACSEQEQLLKRIQKLEVEAFESNLNGLSCLFETGQKQNLEIKDFGYHCKSSVNEINISSNETEMVNAKQVPISFSHMKDRAEHERLAFAVDKLIEGHYKQNGIGKFFKIFKMNFPDACHIL